MIKLALIILVFVGLTQIMTQIIIKQMN